MEKLLVLIPEDAEKNKPTKLLNEKLEKIKSFNAGLQFYFESIPYNNFHDVLKKLFTKQNCFFVLGELNDFGKTLEESGRLGYRRKDKEEATIQNRDGIEIVLDLDDHILPGFDALNPEPAIKDWLREQQIQCDATWQITSGQKLQTEDARIRIYFTASKKHSLAYRKAWSQSLGCDGSVYTCSQPIYIASPLFPPGITDPIAHRYGFITGETRNFVLPPLEKAEIERLSSYSRGVEWDYSDPTLPDDVLSGRVYRRYFMPLAFHYANLLNNDREAIFAIIATKAQQVKSRQFDPDNVYAYIDDALHKIKHEKETDAEKIVNIKDIQQKEEIHAIPTFPDQCLSDWPDPWPMLWENFSRVPRQTEPALLFPTMLAANAFFLRARFVTAYGRRPNMFFLNLTPSTGNKDVNSKNVIRDLDRFFNQKTGNLVSVNLFSNIINTESSITADISFLQSFTEEQELFWVNTEATRIFQQIKHSTMNSNVMALSDKLIEVVDGHEITGKIKAAGKIKTISNPNCQVLFYAQPETIEQYIDESMVDSGLFGRALLSIVPNLDFDVENYELVMDRQDLHLQIDDEFVDFYKSEKFNLEFFRDKQEVLKPSKDQMALINLWARDYIVPKMTVDDVMYKVLSRIGNSAEQLYCIVLGICKIYDQHIGAKIRDSIDIMCLLPVLQYWVDTKIYAIENYISIQGDPIAEAILLFIERCLRGEYKMPRPNDQKCVDVANMVPQAQLMRIIRNNKKLLRTLNIRSDTRNVVVRIEQVINALVRTGVLVQKVISVNSGKNSSKLCIGISK